MTLLVSSQTLLFFFLYQLLPVTIADIICEETTCASYQQCCTENGQTSCCAKSTTATLSIVAGVLFAIVLSATGVGICLYFKKRVHKDTPYTVQDIESMYARSLHKEASCRVLETESLGPGSLCDPGALSPLPPVITPGLEASEMRMPSLGSEAAVSTEDKMTENCSTQVTSAKRTVVTVNLNMKEKENIKLNIFMNKDKEEEEERKDATFPQGLSAKKAKKRAALKQSPSVGKGGASVGKGGASEGKGGKRPKSPVKETKSSESKSSVKRKKSKQ